MHSTQLTEKGRGCTMGGGSSCKGAFGGAHGSGEARVACRLIHGGEGADREVDGKAEKCSGCSGEATEQRRRGKARQAMVIEL